MCEKCPDTEFFLVRIWTLFTLRIFRGIISMFVSKFSSFRLDFRRFLVCFSIFEGLAQFSYQLHWKFELSFTSNRSCSLMFVKGTISDWYSSQIKLFPNLFWAFYLLVAYLQYEQVTPFWTDSFLIADIASTKAEQK